MTTTLTDAAIGYLQVLCKCHETLTAGHLPGCPNMPVPYTVRYVLPLPGANEAQPVTVTPTPPVGWLCPRCGAGNAPWNATCPCVTTPAAATEVVPPFTVRTSGDIGPSSPCSAG